MQTTNATVSLQVLHVDEDLLVIDKPSGLLAVTGRGEDKQDCLSRRAQAQYPDALIVHRLDMSTSGLMLMARGAAMQRALSYMFEQRTVFKRYEAVVDGLIGKEEGFIDLPLALDWPRRPLRIVSPEHGKPSQTRWRVLARDQASKCTRVELEPLTGRSHQLRVHLQALGHPIWGDALYAPQSVQSKAPRLLLHACQLRLTHPASGNEVSFESTAPF